VPLDPETTVGPVSLTVRDAEAVARFYQRAVGLRAQGGAPGRVALGVDGEALVELVEDPHAPPRRHGTTGLYHLALLVPDRAELARSLLRIAATGTALVGASDHLVSEALYLSDPEGNGIEIYRDRPRTRWRRDGDEIEMATLPLDLRDVASAADGDPGEQAVSSATRVGHVHLNVSDLGEAERFYGELLGFEVTARRYPGALFLAADGYHHHIGLNTWAGQGAAPPPRGTAGLRSFAIALPGEEALEGVAGRLRAAGAPLELGDRAVTTEDPSRNRVVLRANE
jgi:catechol 2,3-dioxygenase